MRTGLAESGPCESTWVVTPSMCPHFAGELVHPVYATWTMVEHMEAVGRRLIVPFLEAHEEAVGAHIRVDHESPAMIGSTVTVRAEVESLSSRRLTCRVSARCGERLVGQGVFVQVVMSKTRLATLLFRSTPD